MEKQQKCTSQPSKGSQMTQQKEKITSWYGLKSVLCYRVMDTCLTSVKYFSSRVKIHPAVVKRKLLRDKTIVFQEIYTYNSE
jgi:hypothetical protein